MPGFEIFFTVCLFLHGEIRHLDDFKSHTFLSDLDVALHM